ncbi:hypothetical protein [Haladaptatus sp. DFWS20]|uniref:hypothetical protein n=1 Tax=Haladaptatus sp. DFWS20 TaxID=3403467 RepID=UPI003EBC7B64
MRCESLVYFCFVFVHDLRRVTDDDRSGETPIRARALSLRPKSGRFEEEHSLT